MPRTLLTAFAAVLLLSSAVPSSASFRTWKDTDGTTLQADLRRFDLASKAVILQDDSGTEHLVATNTLNLRSRFQLLFSAEFLQAFPDERWSAQRFRIIVTLTSITGLFFLVGFWLAAIFIVHNANPFKAAIGWLGSLLVAAFLFFVYLTAARKFPEYTAAILGAGVGVSFIVAAVLVSAVYNSRIGSALALFVLHFAAGVLLFLGALHALDAYAVPPHLESFLTEQVFLPVGLL